MSGLRSDRRAEARSTVLSSLLAGGLPAGTADCGARRCDLAASAASIASDVRRLTSSVPSRTGERGRALAFRARRACSRDAAPGEEARFHLTALMPHRPFDHHRFRLHHLDHTLALSLADDGRFEASQSIARALVDMRRFASTAAMSARAFGEALQPPLLKAPLGLLPFSLPPRLAGLAGPVLLPVWRRKIRASAGAVAGALAVAPKPRRRQSLRATRV